MKNFKFPLVLVLCLTLAQPLMGRNAIEDTSASALAMTEDPAFCIAAHRVGKISLSVNNNGNLGIGWSAGGLTVDCFTGVPVPSCEYPINSGIEHLYAASLWIGATIAGDTLVSTGADGWSCEGAEYRPGVSPDGDMIYRSTLYPEDPDIFDGAVSEEDYIAVYQDTFPYVDPFGGWQGEVHRPLKVEVTQSSYAWSGAFSEDFVIIVYKVQNIGGQTLQNVSAGLYVDADVGYEGLVARHTDDVSGFVGTRSLWVPGGCEYDADFDLAWTADNDGDPDGDVFDEYSCPDVTGVGLLYVPTDPECVSFNWWVSNGNADIDFGPREQSGMGTWPEDFRDFGTGGGLGTPEGDHNKYYMLRNQEIDYDQIFTATIPSGDPLWLYPNQYIASDLADGFDTRYLLSFGPIGDLHPGESFPFVVAYVGGEDFHIDPMNRYNLPYSPQAYYDNLNFDDLLQNARWASWVFDNPGVDTDQDGYYGEMIDTMVCGGPTTWISGDGVPDFSLINRRPSPPVWAGPVSKDAITVRWNGLSSETTNNWLAQESDFGGYNVYLSTDGSAGSYALVGSKLSEHGADTEIKRTYPSQPYPSTLNPANADPSELTEDGFFKYFEYELTIPGLGGEPCWHVGVSAFDFGVQTTGLGPTESNWQENVVEVWMPTHADGLENDLPQSYILMQNSPNPFNPSTEIWFELPVASKVRLEVFNIAGQKVTTLIDGHFNAGRHSASWDASQAASGVYLYKLQAGEFVDTKKMILLK